MSLYGQMKFTDDNDESLQSKGGSNLKFGLNNAKLVKFEFNPNGGKEGAPQERLDIVFNIGGTEVNAHMFPINAVYATPPNEKTQTLVKIADIQAGGGVNHYAYDALMADLTQFNAVVTHIVTKFVPTDSWKNVYNATPIQSFQDLCNRAASLIKAVPNWQDKPLHLFAQYQFSIKKRANRTYLEVPANMKQGRWLEDATKFVGNFKAVVNQELLDNEQANDSDVALQYVNDAGLEHSFKRTKWFMTSPYSNQQKDGVSNTPSNPTTPSPSNGAAPTTENAW